MSAVGRYFDDFKQIIQQDTDEMPKVKGKLVILARGILAVWRDVSEGQLTLRAMSLSFTTLLSLVPLLALSFSVLKGFGVHNSM